MGERQAKLNINFSSSGGIVGKGAPEKKKPKACENHIEYFLTKRSLLLRKPNFITLPIRLLLGSQV
jgi:hypothetical protein